ncbi:hypothetical protein ACUN8C_01730 [Kushneria sp. Sum13]|uniref:hypothetical protein n=1 Tax=Kushneria sp. Sum13 TaxID=3459196 RepID=UPI00404558F3
MNMKFSPSALEFYPAQWLDAYKKAGTLPNDIIDVAYGDYETFALQSPPKGKMLGVNDDGLPAWVDAPAPPPMPVSEHRQNAFDWIDATADRIRASDRSVGQYLNAEYQLVAQALIDYRNNPEGEVPDAIRSYAAAEGLAIDAAAQQIAEAAARVQELLQAVRRIRLAGKAAIRDAGDDANFMETARPYIDQLNKIPTGS